jgi:hypothetical protein
MVSTDFTFSNETGNGILTCAFPPRLPPTINHLQCFSTCQITAKYVSDVRLMLVDKVHPKIEKRQNTHIHKHIHNTMLYTNTNEKAALQAARRKTAGKPRGSGRLLRSRALHIKATGSKRCPSACST